MANLAERKYDSDVVIIGCGAGGGVIAKELGEAGLRVTVLEGGKRYCPESDYRTDQPDFALRSAFHGGDPNRDLYTWTGSGRFHYTRVKGVGGSTLAYLAVSPRFHESDFRVLSQDGVGADWPITYADLEPYYTKVEYELGVSGPDGGDANPFEPPRSAPFPTPAHTLNAASQVVKRGADKLGLHLTPTPIAIPSRDWRGRPACIGTGVCELGCRIRAKSSIDVTYVPKAEATGNVHIRAQSTVREIILDSDGKARSVVYMDSAGGEYEINGRAIVVAGNAIETPRLLLLSVSNRFPNGLANSSGLVGKYFMEHLGLFVDGVMPERVDPWHGIPAGGVIQDFYETNRRHSFARGWMIEVNNGYQWPSSVARRVTGWGRAHTDRMHKIFGHTVGLATVGEQLPDIRNEVSLDPAVKDTYGLPVPRLVNEPRKNDQMMIKAMAERLKELLRAAGAREVGEPEYKRGGSSHYLGTCRMGRDPAHSVVDPWCRTHDVRNLFIGDGSVFVTGAAVNPALTISALATRTAEGMVTLFKRGEL